MKEEIKSLLFFVKKIYKGITTEAVTPERKTSLT